MVTLAVTFGLSFIAIENVLHDAKMSAATDLTVTRANAVEAALADVATGVRAYVATGNTVALNRYRLAVRRHEALVVELDDGFGGPVELEHAHVAMTAVRAFVQTSAAPIVALAARDLPAAQALLKASDHTFTDRLNSAISRTETFLLWDRAFDSQRRPHAVSQARRALEISVFGFLGIVVMALLCITLLERTAVRPIRALARAMLRVGDGDLSARADGHGAAEIGALERGFNWMAESLEHHHDELEAQHVELEAQHTELEDALDQLAQEKGTALRLFGFVEQLMAETDVRPIARVIFEGMADAVGAEVGMLYAQFDEVPDAFSLAAVRGVEAGTVPATKSAEDGISGRALGQQRPVLSDPVEMELRPSLLDKQATLQHEIHVPLLSGARRLGVVTLGRLHPAPFNAADVELLSHMADQASVALGNALALEQSRRLSSLNETLLNSSRDGVRLVALDGTLTAENPRMREMLKEVLGVTQDALVNGSHWELAAHVANRTTAPESYRRHIKQIRANPHAETEHEFELANSGRVLRRFTAPVIGADGVVVGTVFTIREVTEERQLQKLKDEFVATVTHELRTPLTSIVGFTELLLSEEPGNVTEDQRDFLETIQRNSERLLRLVDDLLFFARLESGKLELKSGEVDLDALVADSVEAARPAAERGQVTVEVGSAGVPSLQADGVRVAQLIDNLLSNAVKFTSPGGRVELSTALRNGNAVLTVSDSGIGIPDAEKEKLFSRFFRATSATDEAIPGTGLGLSITKAIAEAHGGSIAVSDSPGGGTTFTVELPLRAVHAAVAA